MTTWAITAEGVARETYEVEANTEAEARRNFMEAIGLRGPFYTETSDLEIIELERVE